MSVGIILGILFTHFVADFIFQTDKQALNKSKSNVWLSAHVTSYSVGLFLFGLIVVGFTQAMIAWVLLNALLHWITDYFTSRLNSFLWQKQMRHWFFVGIGADQFIHYTCLLLTFQVIH